MLSYVRSSRYKAVYVAQRAAVVAKSSNQVLICAFTMFIALDEMPTSLWALRSTLYAYEVY